MKKALFIYSIRNKRYVYIDDVPESTTIEGEIEIPRIGGIGVALIGVQKSVKEHIYYIEAHDVYIQLEVDEGDNYYVCNYTDDKNI